MTARRPPHDLEAEEGALGAAMLSAEALAVVLSLLGEEDFYRPAHRTVYRALRDLAARGTPVDPVTVGAELSRAGLLADVGGAPFLHTLVAGVPTAANAAHYAATVADRARVRRVIDVGHQLVQVGYEEPRNADRAVALAREILERVAAGASSMEAELLAGLRDGAWLDAQDFPPLAYTVPGIIPEGSVLLVGPPKIGKSWLVLTISLAAATGGKALGLDVPKRPVLYLALEDGDRRLQDRCRKLLGDDPIPHEFEYLTRVEQGRIVDTITSWLSRRRGQAAPLVVLDTLGKVMPPALLGESSYQRDYRIGTTLKRLADQHPGMTLLTNHHDRKAGADDFVDSVSGTHGLAGAADTIIVLTRSRHEADGLLRVTGRDVPEGEYALRFTDGCTWDLDGANLAEAAARARQARLIGGVGDRSAEIIAFVADNPPSVTAAKVEEKFGRDARQYLKRLADMGRLRRLQRGVYTTVTSVTSSLSQASEPNPGDSGVTGVTSEKSDKEGADHGEQLVVTHVTDVTPHEEPDDPARWTR